MSDLADFLLARIAEDEAMAQAARDRVPLIYDTAVLRDKGIGIAQAGHIARWDPARVLAECEAKRRIVESARHTLFDDPFRRTEFWRGARDVADADLRFLALPYADHPEYREEWRP